jgi:hypothetical protein
MHDGDKQEMTPETKKTIKDLVGKKVGMCFLSSLLCFLLGAGAIKYGVDAQQATVVTAALTAIATILTWFLGGQSLVDTAKNGININKTDAVKKEA